MAETLLTAFGVTDTKSMIQYTKDRPFNDLRYPVDGSKLRQLGWEQKVSFEEGLRACVDWYGKYSGWWGDIESILSPFPVVNNEENSLDGASNGKAAKSGEHSVQAAVGAEDAGPFSNGNGQLYELDAQA